MQTLSHKMKEVALEEKAKVSCSGNYFYSGLILVLLDLLACQTTHTWPLPRYQKQFPMSSTRSAFRLTGEDTSGKERGKAVPD